MKAIITIGVSASGKTSWARQQKGFYEVSRDNYRWYIMGEKGLTPCWANWKWKWENQVTEMIMSDLELAAEKKANIIICDLNLNKARRDQLDKTLTDMGWDVEYKVFHVSFDEAIRRDAARADGVGPWVIAKQWEQYIQEFGEGRVVEDTTLQDAIIVDIDGTVALMNGKRSPYDWAKVSGDDPFEPTWAMISGLYNHGHHVIFLSGRDGVCYTDTLNWILEHSGKYMPSAPFDFHMRAPGDTRPDTVIKRELFDAHVRGRYNVKAVLDDRPRVARMWRDLGLNVVQFGNPYIDF